MSRMTTSVIERLKTGKFGNARCHCDDVLRFTDSKLLIPFLRVKVSSHVTHLFRFPIKCCHLCSSSQSIHTSCLSTAAVWKWSLHKQKEQSYAQLAGQVACQTLEPRVVNSQNCSNSWHVEPGLEKLQKEEMIIGHTCGEVGQIRWPTVQTKQKLTSFCLGSNGDTKTAHDYFSWIIQLFH